MSNETDTTAQPGPMERAARMFEDGSLGYPPITGDDPENPGPTVWGAADALAKVQELFKSDPDYAETLGISRRGMDFITGAEATLRAASIDL
ncbi:hypothetical protein [Paeniglutamicibacter antarcticus]|uniref:Uncharacterized protein n=1 Tax=Paeniglutamicibacter antarcticus TaxID=494023 RepID=A0ABP9TQ82_9MICC